MEVGCGASMGGFPTLPKKASAEVGRIAAFGGRVRINVKNVFAVCMENVKNRKFQFRWNRLPNRIARI